MSPTAADGVASYNIIVENEELIMSIRRVLFCVLIFYLLQPVMVYQLLVRRCISRKNRCHRGSKVHSRLVNINLKLYDK